MMTDSIPLSELHGVAVSSPRETDEGFPENQTDLEAHDDVFLDENHSGSVSVEEKSTIGGLKTFQRKRKQTSRSSGYGSEIPGSDSGEGKNAPEKQLAPQQSIESSKEKRSVFSQTDFSTDEDIAEKVLSASPVPANLVKDTLPKSIDNFCWRHDNVYDKILFPPARPTSACSVDEQFQVSKSPDHSVPQKVKLSKKSCKKCKYEESVKIDLSFRKECSILKKEPLHTSVAEVKNCAVNLLAEEIERCSSLWTENRTFYLGTPYRKVNSARNQRSLSCPSATIDSRSITATLKQRRCFHCSNENVCKDVTNTHRSCARHTFWIQRISLNYGEILFDLLYEKDPDKFVDLVGFYILWDLTFNSTTKLDDSTKRNKRDWILVQCVSKFILSKESLLHDGMSFSYRQYGEQEMILCPYNLRSIEYIEEVCCQHFINMTRRQAIENERTLELLYSPKGPMLREEKHLEGKSIFYFCCDYPIKQGRSKKSYFPSNMQTDAEETLNMTENIKFSKPRTIDPGKAQQRPSAVGFIGANGTKLFANRHKSAKASNASISTNLTTIKEQQKTKSKKESISGTTEEETEDEKMKKNVSFAADINELYKDAEKKPLNATNQGEIANHNDITRRHSMPPPPPKYLGEEEKDQVFFRRKRRESVAISFGSNSIPPKKENSPVTPSSLHATAKPYEKPKWNSLTLNVQFKNKTYSGDFMEYHTLEDLYSWVKTQLLKDDMFTPGTDLLLSCDNVKCPLKANTASNTLGNLAFTEFICSEVQQARKGSGFGDSASRYDTRFSIPVDMRHLENLTPIQYLSRYCSISETWKIFYRSIFTQYDFDRDGSICYKELKKAMEKLFVELANPLLKRVLFLLGFDPASNQGPLSINHSAFDNSNNLETEKWKDELTIGKDTFVLICALANRIICRENKIGGFCVSTVTQSHTELEDADFYNIEGKMRECSLDPLTKRLLLYIKK